MKKVKVCKKCSGFDIKELKELLPAKVLKIGCVGKCSKKCPELSGKFFGLIDGELLVRDTKEDFLAELHKR